jgi:hypothetical protein
MPALTNCGGFSDILSYTPESAPDGTAPVAAPAPKPAASVSSQEEGRRKMEVKASLERSKRAILLSLISIGVSVVTLICVIICLVQVNKIDYYHSSEVQFEESEPTKSDAGKVKVEEEAVAIDEKVFSFPSSTLLGIVSDAGNENIHLEIVAADNSVAYDKEVSADEFKAGFMIEFKAHDEQFPMIVVYNDVELPGMLELAGKKAEWRREDLPPEESMSTTPKESEKSDEKVMKTGVVDLAAAGFNEKDGTKVEIRYENKILNEETKDKLYKKDGETKVPVKVNVAKSVDEIDVKIKYSGKELSATVKLTSAV